MWMHNGGIAEFEKMKRRLQSSLPEELFLFVEGNTDSEWAFALFLSFVCLEIQFLIFYIFINIFYSFLTLTPTHLNTKS